MSLKPQEWQHGQRALKHLIETACARCQLGAHAQHGHMRRLQALQGQRSQEPLHAAEAQAVQLRRLLAHAPREPVGMATQSESPSSLVGRWLGAESMTSKLYGAL